MRTTIDLPHDLDAIARAIAHDQRRSLSSVVADLMRRGLDARHHGGTADLPTRNGFPLLDLGVVTTEDVRRLEDE